MSKIDEEIEQVADKLEKSTKTVQDSLIETIEQLGPEELKARMGDLNKSEKALLYDALEEIKKSKAVEMDDEYQAEYVKGNIKDTILQEDKADDDQDEKLVKPEAAKHNHQGDISPEGREGQVIKSEDSEDLLEQVKKSDDMMYKMISKMCKMGKEKDLIMDKCMAKGMDKDKVSGMIDRAMADHNKKMHKSGDSIKESIQLVKSWQFLGLKEDQLFKAVETKGREFVSEKVMETIAKSIEADVEDTEDFLKSMDYDMEMFSDFCETDDVDFAKSLLEKAKTVSRQGIRYYAEGPNAGKPVGSVRGDKAGVKAIARARRKGKISAKAAKQGIKRTNESEAYERKREKAGMGRTDSKEQMQRIVRRDLASKKEGLQSPKYKQASRKHIDAQAEAAKPVREAREKMEREGSKKKDGSYKKTKKNDALAQEIAEKREEKRRKTAQQSMDFDRNVRKPTAEAGRKKEKELAEKQSKMNKEAKKRSEASMKKSDSMEKTRKAAETKMDDTDKKKKMNKEEDQISDTNQMTEGKVRGDKKKPEALKLENDNKANMTKSIVWAGENDLLKSGRGQQNHHFSVNGYYDEVLAKSQEEANAEELQKSENEERDEDLNDIIEKSQDTSADDVLTKSLLEENKGKINGRLAKSFEDNEIAQALGLTEEEAKKILGE